MKENEQHSMTTRGRVEEGKRRLEMTQILGALIWWLTVAYTEESQAVEA